MKQIENVGIVGVAGMRGKQLLPLFNTMSEEAAVTAVVDVAPVEREVLLKLMAPFDKGKFSISTRFEDLLSGPNEVDAIVVASPDYLHEQHTLAALAAGKHVYLEKPMALTPEGCDRILAAARKSGCFLYVGHNLRHFTVIKRLKELIDEGVVGEVKAIWCRHPVSYGRWAYYKEGRWQKKRENVGGLLIHKGSHDLDVIHWLAGGRTTRVVAMGQLAVWKDQPDEPDVEDMSSVLMQLDNGVQATYSQCHFAYLAFREYVVMGTKGTLRNVGDDPATAKVELFATRKMNVFNQVTKEWTFKEESGFHGDADHRIVSEFFRVQCGLDKPTIAIEDAAWAVKTGWAATYSLRNGNVPVEVR